MRPKPAVSISSDTSFARPRIVGYHDRAAFHSQETGADLLTDIREETAVSLIACSIDWVQHAIDGNAPTRVSWTALARSTNSAAYPITYAEHLVVFDMTPISRKLEPPTIARWFTVHAASVDRWETEWATLIQPDSFGVR